MKRIVTLLSLIMIGVNARAAQMGPWNLFKLNIIQHKLQVGAAVISVVLRLERYAECVRFQ